MFCVILQRMPFLQSFCMFAAMGILFLFIFELSLFVACLTLDEYRVASKRDGCCFIKPKEWKPNSFSQHNWTHDIFMIYVGPFLMKRPVKVNALKYFIFFTLDDFFFKLL